MKYEGYSMLRRLNHLGIFLFFALASTKILAVTTPAVSGSLERDTSVDYFDLSIKISDISKPKLIGTEKSLFTDRIRIWLTDLSSSTNEYVPFDGDPALVTVPFTLKQLNDLVQTSNANSLTDFTYSVRISANTIGGLKSLLDSKGGGKNIKIKVIYREDQTMISTLETQTISISTAIVKDAPTGLAATGTYRSIIATWTPATTVTWTADPAKAASGITAVALDLATANLNLPSYIYDSSAVVDAAGADDACEFIPDFADGANCISCPNSNAYLNTKALSALSSSGKFLTTATASVGKTTISGLENDKEYAVVLYYQPGGLARSTCVHATPAANVTWSELNGEKEATLADPKCFIATAAYGSPLHKNLKPLRWFRDHVLLKTNLGSRFVDWYYLNGPRAARVVSAHPGLQLTVQALLWLPVIGISAWMALLSTDPMTIQLTLTGLVAGLAVTIYIKRKARETIG
jgi:hypothetical protein